MEIRPHRIIKRKKTKKIKVGNVYVGGDSVISVQSMTNTLTTDYVATIKQINELEQAGAENVLVTGGGIIPKDDVKELEDMGIGRLFGPGTSTKESIAYVKEWFAICAVSK